MTANIAIGSALTDPSATTVPRSVLIASSLVVAAAGVGVALGRDRLPGGLPALLVLVALAGAFIGWAVARLRARTRTGQDAFARSLMDSSPDCVKVLDLDGRLLDMNDPGRKIMEIDDFAFVCGREWQDLWPLESRVMIRAAVTAASQGESTSLVAACPTAKGSPRWWEVRVTPVHDAGGKIVRLLSISRDVTERKRVEARQAYLIRLADTLRPLSDPVKAQAAATHMLGEHLGANRVAYFEIVDDEYVVRQDHVDGVPSLAGRYPVASFGEGLLGDYRSGRTVVEADATNAPGRSDAERAAFAAIGVHGHVDVPLVKQGRFVAGITVQSAVPRAWTPADVEIVEQTAERTWAAVERAKAEVALRESEERLRVLFNSMDEGFCIIEFIDGPHGPSSDYVHILANPAYASNAGIPYIVGQRVRELVPDEASAWVETYLNVLVTGQPIRFERELVATGRHLDLAAFRIEPPERRQVAVLFKDITARRLAEQRLRDSEERFRGIFTQSLVGIAETDQEGRFLEVNQQYCEITGRSAEELAALRMQEITHPDDLPRNLSLLSEAFAEGGSFAIEKRYVRPDGSIVWVNNSVSVVRDAAGNPRHIVAACLDVTAAKRSELAIRESERRYRLVGDAAHDAIWDWDLVTNQVTWNEGVLTCFGFEARQVATDAGWWVDHIHPDDRDRIVHDIHEAIDGGRERWQGEYRFRRADGTYADVFDRGRVVRDGGRPTRMVGSMLDLTERKRAEAELRRVAAEADRQRRLYDAVLGNTPDLAYVFGLDERFTYANPATLAMWGRTWDEAIGKNCLELGYEPWHAEMHGREIEQVVATGKPVRGEVTFTGTAGKREYDYILVPVFGTDGTVEAVAGTTRDVTDAKASAAAIRDSEEQLRDADRRKDEFLATLAHELRNPLAPIRNGLQVLRLADDRESRDRARSMMERQLEQMVRLVDDLLDVSRVSRGKLELRLRHVSLAAVVSNAVETALPIIEQMGHELSLDLPDQPIIVEADATRLAQVFLNLLTNAAKYSDRDGSIRVSAVREGSDVVVIVADRGIGIDNAQLPRVFEMFSQVAGSLEKSQGGLGIGLTLVRRLVEMHGGRVEARSEGVGLGSEFVVRLPVVVAASVPLPPTPTADDASLPTSLRILVVDDNRDGADSLAMMLSIMGNDTRTAYDGAEAVATAAAFKPDVILLDIGLPKMNGYDACRRIRATEDGSRPMIVAQTGWGAADDRQRSRDAGFDHHLVKPVDPSALLALLRDLPAQTAQ